MTPDLSTIPTDQIIAELKARRDQLDTVISTYGSLTAVVETIVARGLGIAPSSMHRDSKVADHTLPRQVVMTLLRENGRTWQQCADVFGMDHGNAIYAAKTIARREDTDPTFADLLRDLREQLAAALRTNRS